jgi:hypothetical protein
MLLTPEHDVDDPELSIVILTMEEELTVMELIRSCDEGLADAGISGEILLAGSSSDKTVERAQEAGARLAGSE